MNVIVHDVARTKILHPLFESGGQGLAMLKRVLIRCAELGAVKEAGYIQVRPGNGEVWRGLRAWRLALLVPCICSKVLDFFWRLRLQLAAILSCPG